MHSFDFSVLFQYSSLFCATRWSKVLSSYNEYEQFFQKFDELI